MADKPAPSQKELEERLAMYRERLVKLGTRLAFKGGELDHWIKEELWRNKETRALLKQLEESRKRVPADVGKESQAQSGSEKPQPSVGTSLKTGEEPLSWSMPAPSATASKKIPEKPVKPGISKPRLFALSK
ncbi:hypothetical protein MRX96_025560 [Rhipicephalus microplus]